MKRPMAESRCHPMDLRKEERQGGWFVGDPGTLDPTPFKTKKTQRDGGFKAPSFSKETSFASNGLS